jgi:hypothetical protein
MKISKKIFGLLLGMFLTVTTFANGVVTYTDAVKAEKSKTEGAFNFSFDSNFTLEQINKSAAYYKNYFVVTPVKSESGINVNIKLTEDNEMSRRVITRFFVSLEVKEIMVNGALVKTEDFIAKFVMK